MTEPQDDSEAMENYLLNRDTAEERAAFEARLESDPALKEELRFQRIVVALLREGRKNELKKRLAEKIAYERENYRPIYAMPVVRLAAALLILGGIGFVLYEYTYLPTLFQPKEAAKTAYEVPAAATPETADSQVAITEPSPTLEPDTMQTAYAPPVLEEIKAEEQTQMNTERIAALKEPASAPVSLSEIPAENIRGDVLLLDTVLEVAIIPLPRSVPDTGVIYGELPAPEDSATYAKLRVFFFKSPVNYKGYKHFRNELQLFGLHPRELTGLYRVDGTLYLRKGHEIYALIAQNSFNNYISVQNPEILKLLRR